MENENIAVLDNLKKYGVEFQNKCLTCLLTDRAFMERIVEILSPDYFETAAHKWVIEQVIQYFLKYKDLPTPNVMRVQMDTLIDEQMRLLRQSIGDLLALVYGYQADTDLQYVKEQFLEFCKNQTLKNAILKSVDHLKKGEYDSIKHVVDTALRAGMERNLGHDYFVDVDKRMNEVARKCVKTNWELIDQHLDGGLGKGELGFIVAPAGSGKCVGPNTEIDIRYMETGIPILGNSGKEYVMWINPFEKYNMGSELGVLYGWQIDDIFFELEKMKCRLLEQEK